MGLRAIAVLCSGVVLLAVRGPLARGEEPTASAMPDAAKLVAMTARFAPVDIGADVSRLPDNERQALARLGDWQLRDIGISRADAEIEPGLSGEIQVVQLFFKERPVQRPLRERNFKKLFGRGDKRFAGPYGHGCDADGRRGLRGLFDEIAAVNNLDHGLQSSSMLVVVEL